MARPAPLDEARGALSRSKGTTRTCSHRAAGEGRLVLELQERTLRELDECFSSLERCDDPPKLRVETPQQLHTTSVPDSDPHDGRTVVQEEVDDEVLVLRDDHRARFRSPRTNLRIRSPLQTEISDMFGLVAARLDVARQRWWKLGVYEKAQSRAPQDEVVVLLGRKLQDRGDVLGFEVGIVREDLFTRGAGSEKVEQVLHADAKASDARTATANVGTHCDPVERAHIGIVARPGAVKVARHDGLPCGCRAAPRHTKSSWQSPYPSSQTNPLETCRPRCRRS